MFTDEQRKSLRIGKYTKWAEDLSFDELRGLFWALGEVSVNGAWMFRAIDAQLPLERDAASRRRPWAALRLLQACVRRHRVGSEQMSRAIITLACHPTGDGLSEEGRERLAAVVPLLRARAVE